MKMGMKTGAKIAHFGITPGMMKSRRRMTMMNTDQERERGECRHLSKRSAMALPPPPRGRDAEIEIGNELGDHQEHEDEAREAGEGLGHAAITSPEPVKVLAP